MEKEDLKKQESIDSAVMEALPLVLEIAPGQATDGLVTIFEPAEYAGKQIGELAQAALGKDVSLEERDVVNTIKQQLSGGKLLYRGEEAKMDDFRKYAAVDTTEKGEKFFYIKLQAIKPEEGGSYRQ